jgi:arsenite methyltransferase
MSRIRILDPVLGQLRKPHGPLAPVTARVLNLVNQPINRWTIGSLDLNGDEDVLDVGFGGGVGLALVLRRLTSGRAAGIDISEEMLQGARERFSKEMATKRLVVSRADVAAIPFADGSFDRAYTVNTVFFWPDVPAGLSEIHRVLRPGGRLVIAAPTGGFMLARIGGLSPRTGVTGLMQTKRLAMDAGFQDIRLVNRGGASLLLAARG